MLAIKAIIALFLLPLAANGFGSTNMAAAVFTRSGLFRRFRLPIVPAATSAPDEEVAVADNTIVSSIPPSWEELTTLLESKTLSGEKERPLVTLYRDTNGWCPFCERVWLILRVKNIPYEEQLVPLQGKPDWYKALVPTSLVPAILLHGDEGSTERRVVWESLDIMLALDEAFPDTPKMVLDTVEYKEAMELHDRVTAAGFAFNYGNRNGTATEEEKETKRMAFMGELDELDAALAESSGPFRLGNDFTGLDATMVPILERWRHQLPLTQNVDILENRPNIQAWFDAMDSFAPYSDRVAGDAYSWTATNSMFLRYFGGGEDKPEVQEAIKRTDAIAEKLTKSFTKGVLVDDKFAIEAAAKLITNHEGVVKDCTKQDPLSQKDIIRGSDKDAADSALRYVASVLLSPTPLETATNAPLVDIPTENIQEASRAVSTVAARTCVPRDMGLPAAKLFRGVLATVSERLNETP